MSRRQTPAMKPCVRCAQPFGRRANEDLYRFHGRIYCSRACSDPGRSEAARSGETARFMSYVLPEPHSGCWLWLGPLTRGDYGTFNVASRDIRAHRYSYTMFKGDIPDGLLVRHVCDNRLCVNPDHLLLGTNKDNSRDAIERGRHVCGERHHLAKLTDAQALALLHDPRRQCVLAAEYGVSRATVCTIKSGKHWAHLQARRVAPEKTT